MPRIRVLVIDDSAVVRKLMSDIFKNAEGIELVGTALDPYIAAEKIKVLNPDVVTLDIEMPRMDGLTFLSKLMMARPLPVIMVSSLTDQGAGATIRAMEAGAVDYVLKPSVDSGEERWEQFGKELIEKINIAAKANVSRKNVKIEPIFKTTSEKINKGNVSSQHVIAIGASTGGTEVITQILCAMKPEMPGIVITQHMPPKFTEAFAQRIDSMAEIIVAEAVNGDRVSNGHAYIAPGGTQMYIRKDTLGYKIEVNDDPPINRHKPSVDALFNSVARNVGENALGVILTGMGSDGASGLLAMKESGAHTIAQDEQSSIVFGMPREAIRMGAADSVMNIEGMIAFMIKHFLNR